MSYYFKLPRYTELNDNQKLAVEEIYSISLSGGPGTGKTVVSLWRHIQNYLKVPITESLLLTYTKTLEYYLKQTALKENPNASKNIDRTQRWVYDNYRGNFEEIIVDEAQDVPLHFYHTISNHADEVSYGADDAQSLYDGTCTSLDLRSLFSENEEYELEKNYRNSREILEFTQSVFPDISIPRNVLSSSISTGRKPFCVVLGWDDFEDSVVDTIIEISQEFPEDTHNIGVLVPGHNQVNSYYERLRSHLQCSRYHSKMLNFETLDRIHITTFKSAKGLEFDTVIIPNFGNYNWYINETERHSEKDFYVALTRAKLNLYLLCKKKLNIFANTYIPM